MISYTAKRVNLLSKTAGAISPQRFLTGIAMSRPCNPSQFVINYLSL